MGLFLKKSALFAYSFSRQKGVLSWKMIARHHSQVHRTAGHFVCAWRKAPSPLCSDFHHRESTPQPYPEGAYPGKQQPGQVAGRWALIRKG
jgi:hypothetical protein